MTGEYELTSKVYDPLLFPFMRGVRIKVTGALAPFRDRPVLDLCCGTGDQLRHLARAGHTHLSGVDLCPHMLAVARRGGHGFTLYERDATDTGLVAGSFDAVILSFAIHEKAAAVRTAMLAEAHRLLGAGGTLLVVDYRFDEHTLRLAAGVITTIERIAGREHFRSFCDFRRNGGLDPLLPADRWRPLQSERVLFGGVTISRYGKL